jgi:hypothetical protein
MTDTDSGAAAQSRNTPIFNDSKEGFKVFVFRNDIDSEDLSIYTIVLMDFRGICFTGRSHENVAASLVLFNVREAEAFRQAIDILDKHQDASGSSSQEG